MLHKKHLIFTLLLPLFLITQIAAQEMQHLTGGQVRIGDDTGLDNEKPAFQTILKSFLIDENLVTVGQFRLFAKINGYISDAEKNGQGHTIDSISYDLVGIKGAYWAYPLGPEQPKAKSYEPVRQISYHDAAAYANWVGKRLPSEYELEYAAQNAAQLGIQHLDGFLWQWSDTWYQAYDASEYFQNTLNRKKTLKGGVPPKEKEFRASMRQEALPNQARYEVGFRCAKDIKP